MRGLDVEWNKSNIGFDANVERLTQERDAHKEEKIAEIKRAVEQEYYDKVEAIEDQRADKKKEYEEMKAFEERKKYEVRQ